MDWGVEFNLKIIKMGKYWFKTQQRWYLFYPVSIEWRLIMLVFFIILLFSANINWFPSADINWELTNSNLIHFAFDTILIAIIFVLLVKDKIKNGNKLKPLN